MLLKELDTRMDGDGVSICPGPDLAYFSKIISLKEMTDHIYGKGIMISRTGLPNIFIKELNIYIDYYWIRIEVAKYDLTQKQERYLLKFGDKLNEGIS